MQNTWRCKCKNIEHIQCPCGGCDLYLAQMAARQEAGDTGHMCRSCSSLVKSLLALKRLDHYPAKKCVVDPVDCSKSSNCGVYQNPDFEEIKCLVGRVWNSSPEGNSSTTEVCQGEQRCCHCLNFPACGQKSVHTWPRLASPVTSHKHSAFA